MSECLQGTPNLQSGTNQKERAGQKPDARGARKSPIWGSAIWERGCGAALKSLCNDWEKMTTFCSKTWNKISSAASFSLHFSTEPVTGSVGAGWIYSLGSAAAIFSYTKLKQLFALVGLLSPDKLILTLDPLSLRQCFFFVSLFIHFSSSPWSAFLLQAYYWLLFWPENS